MVEKKDDKIVEDELYVKNPHDKFVRFILSQVDNFKVLLEKSLRIELLNQLDLQTLKIVKETFMDELLLETRGDIVAECCYKKLSNEKTKKVLLLFLFEHKSYSDFLVLLQNLNYMVSIWKNKSSNVKWNSKPDDFEIIIPIVFYHGKEAWKVPLEFKDLFNTNNEEFLHYIPNYKYELIEVTEDKFEKYSSNRNLLLLAKALYYSSHEQMLTNYRELLYLCKDGFGVQGHEIFNSLTIYILNTSEVKVEDYIEAAKNIILYSYDKENSMSTAEKLYKQGYNEAQKEIELKLQALSEMIKYSKRESEIKIKEAEKTKKEAEKTKQEAEKTKQEAEESIEKFRSKTEEEVQLIKKQISDMVKVKFPSESIFIEATIANFTTVKELLQLLKLIFIAENIEKLNMGIMDIFKDDE